MSRRRKHQVMMVPLGRTDGQSPRQFIETATAS
jgi:hypothetical protein